MERPLFEAAYVYDDDTIDAAFGILARTRVKAAWRLTVVSTLILSLFIVVVAIVEREYGLLLFAVLFIAALFIPRMRNAESRRYQFEMSLSGGERYWAPDRTLMVYADRCDIYAPYYNPDVPPDINMTAQDAEY